MKEFFCASICVHGVQGGAVYLDDTGFLFRCDKLTIEPAYKNLHIPYENIKSVSEGKRVLLLPTTVIQTKDGETYRFLIFRRKRFIRCIEPYLV